MTGATTPGPGAAPAPGPGAGRAVVLMLTAHTLLSAGTHLVAKRGTAEFEPVGMVLLRLVLAGALFAGLLGFRRMPLVPPRAEWRTVLVFGFLGGPANQGLFLWGIQHSSAIHAALLYALTPVFVYLGALALRRERPRNRRLLGALVAFVGVAVLLALGTPAAGPGGAAAAAGAPEVSVWGDVALLGAVLVWVAWTLEGRRLSVAHGGVQTAGWAMLVGGLLALPLLPFLVDWGALGGVSATAWGCLAYLVVGTSVVSYILWNAALARTEASRVAVFTNLQPLVTALLAALTLGEPIGWETVAGGALVLVGVRLAQT